jgi:hypothetical protein
MAASSANATAGHGGTSGEPWKRTDLSFQFCADLNGGSLICRNKSVNHDQNRRHDVAAEKTLTHKPSGGVRVLKDS